MLVLSDADDAITYTTVYFIERSLSLDNLFVFLLLFSYFGIAGGSTGRGCCSGASRRRSCCAAWRSSAASR